MAAAPPSTLAECSAAIPQSLEEVRTSHANVIQISEYCKGAFQGENQADIYEQTKKYTTDALLNVAYHIHNLGVQLTHYLQLQTLELEKLDVRIQSVNSRLQAAHDIAGISATADQSGFKEYRRQTKMRKLEGKDLPARCAPVQEFVRQPINLDRYNGLVPGSGGPPPVSAAPVPASGSAPRTAAPPTAMDSFGEAPPPPPPR
eukprot:CAMPEP_0177656644 /NCGR_PEP_ID=MMETSP0447-20121125/15694_1 /TAXON_ID=0 /ORGANISM="Stygamoeba regulata, Strain BSH-02190019" /LENGTH=202 /DNA_ID=CAMNT_0019160811 /DNA_START=97 /DNA_END=705 /DNA_ORIENTATION=+